MIVSRDSNPGTAHQVTVTASASHRRRCGRLPTDRGRRRTARCEAAPASRRASPRAVEALSPSSKVTLPSELTNNDVNRRPKNDTGVASVCGDESSSPSVMARPSGVRKSAPVVEMTIAAAVRHEADAAVGEIEGIGPDDQIAVVFEDGDVVDVAATCRSRPPAARVAVRRRGPASSRPRPTGAGDRECRGCQRQSGRTSARASRAALVTRASCASAATHGFPDCARIDPAGAQTAAVTASERMASRRSSMAGRPSYRQRREWDRASAAPANRSRRRGCSGPRRGPACRRSLNRAPASSCRCAPSRKHDGCRDAETRRPSTARRLSSVQA